MYSTPTYNMSTSGLLPSAAGNNQYQYPDPYQYPPPSPFPAAASAPPPKSPGFVFSTHDEYPPQPPLPSPGRTTPKYGKLNFKKIILHTFPLVVVNLILEGVFVYILKIYSAKKILLEQDRRFFNAASLFLAAALSMGIGYLLNQIGFMLRGSLVGKSSNTKEEIGHIWRGSVGSYSLLIWCHVWKRKTWTLVTMVAALFIVGNLAGRLSVGFIGLTYAVDDGEIVSVPALVGTAWPEVGKTLASACLFEEKKRKVENEVFVELLRQSAPGVPFPVKPEFKVIEVAETSDQSGVTELKNTEFLKVPDLKLEVEDNGFKGPAKVSYTYTLNDTGGDPAIRVDRTLEVATECSITELTTLAERSMCCPSITATGTRSFVTHKTNLIMVIQIIHQPHFTRSKGSRYFLGPQQPMSLVDGLSSPIPAIRSSNVVLLAQCSVSPPLYPHFLFSTSCNPISTYSV